jgi:hypothetical protein
LSPLTPKTKVRLPCIAEQPPSAEKLVVLPQSTLGS